MISLIDGEQNCISELELDPTIVQIVEKKKQRENDGVKKPIQKWLEENLNKEEYVYYKNWGGGFNKAGRPDIEIAYRGKIAYWELKDENGVLSTLQKETIRRYACAGITIHVVDSLEDFLEIWQKIFKEEY